MSDLSGYPFYGVEINKSGQLHQPDDLERAKKFVRENAVTDLIVISHGWNNDSQEARQLYAALFASVRLVIDAGYIDLGDRVIGVLGILWPSKKFADSDLIPAGGAASAGGDQLREVVEARLDAFSEALDDPDAEVNLRKVRESIDHLDDDPQARQVFADTVRELLPRDDGAADVDDGADRFFVTPAQVLFDQLAAPFLPEASGSGGGAAGGIMVSADPMAGGGAAGLGDWFSGAKAAARRILNYATYYVMKARAGSVGAGGVRQIVAAVKTYAPSTKIHLVGHSFGGRVVAAAAKALGERGGQGPDTMSLLQAAFSHNGFAKNFSGGRNGYFRAVVESGTVGGAVLITHTHNDLANAIAYPIASRLAGQDAAAIGGARDRFGAIGANGAQHTPEAQSGELLALGAEGYDFCAGKLHNLRADKYVSGHSAITGQEVAYAILAGVKSA